MLVPVPAVPVVIPVPLVPVPVRVGPVAARPPPVVVLVPAVPVGAERPATRLVVAARRPGPVRTGRRGRPGPAVRVRLVAGPVSPVPARPCRLGPCRLGPCRLGSGRRGPRGGGRGDRDRFLPRRAALHGHHRAGTTTLRRGTTAAGAPAGRLGRGGPGTAGGLTPPCRGGSTWMMPGRPRSGMGGSSRSAAGRSNDSASSSLVATIAASDATPRATTTDALRRDDTRGDPLRRRRTGGVTARQPSAHRSLHLSGSSRSLLAYLRPGGAAAAPASRTAPPRPGGPPASARSPRPGRPPPSPRAR
jgi:hypothetical protein